MKTEKLGHQTRYTLDDTDEGSFVRSSHVVTSVMVEEVYGHDKVAVWNRGGLSGELTVTRGDGKEIARRLLQESGQQDPPSCDKNVPLAAGHGEGF